VNFLEVSQPSSEKTSEFSYRFCNPVDDINPLMLSSFKDLLQMVTDLYNTLEGSAHCVHFIH